MIEVLCPRCKKVALHLLCFEDGIDPNNVFYYKERSVSLKDKPSCQACSAPFSMLQTEGIIQTREETPEEKKAVIVELSKAFGLTRLLGRQLMRLLPELYGEFDRGELRTLLSLLNAMRVATSKLAGERTIGCDECEEKYKKVFGKDSMWIA